MRSLVEEAMLICLIAAAFLHRSNNCVFFSFAAITSLNTSLTNSFPFSHIEFRETFAHFRYHGTLFFMPMRAYNFQDVKPSGLHRKRCECEVCEGLETSTIRLARTHARLARWLKSRRLHCWCRNASGPYLQAFSLVPWIHSKTVSCCHFRERDRAYQQATGPAFSPQRTDGPRFTGGGFNLKPPAKAVA